MNRNNFPTSFPIWILLISISCYNTLARTSITVLRYNGKCAPSCLFLIVEVKFLAFCLSMWSLLWIFIYGFIMLHYFPPFHVLFSLFLHEIILIFVKCLSCIKCDVPVGFSLSFFMWYITMINFLHWPVLEFRQ